MSKLKEAVNLRAYEQKSPLNLYIVDGNTLTVTLKGVFLNNVLDIIYVTHSLLDVKRRSNR